jgi:hypothetical protein
MNPDAQNMKTGLDALGTVENESGGTKHENGTRRPRDCQKRLRACKPGKRVPTTSVPPKTFPEAQDTKTGPDTLDTAENESRPEKHENVSLRPLYRRKRVWARKT